MPETSTSRLIAILMSIAVIAFTYLKLIPSDVFVTLSSMAIMHFFNKSTTDSLTKVPESVTIEDKG